MKKRKQTLMRYMGMVALLALAGCDHETLKSIIDDTTQHLPKDSDTEAPSPGVYMGEENSCDERMNREATFALDEAAPITASVDGDVLTVTDVDAVMNCCLTGWMEATVEGSAITIIEVEEPNPEGACFCICGRELSIEIPDLEDGTYEVEVYRFEITEENFLSTFSVSVGESDEPESAGDSDVETAAPTVTNIEISACGETDAAAETLARDIPDEMTEERPDVDTDMSDATDDERPIIYLIPRGDTVLVIDEAMPVNCCADIEVSVTFDEYTITVVEEELASPEDLCRCMCHRAIETEIEGLAVGEYQVNVIHETYDGAKTLAAKLPLHCVDSPQDWAYDGIACVN